MRAAILPATARETVAPPRKHFGCCLLQSCQGSGWCSGCSSMAAPANFGTQNPSSTLICRQVNLKQSQSRHLCVDCHEMCRNCPPSQSQASPRKTLRPVNMEYSSTSRSGGSGSSSSNSRSRSSTQASITKGSRLPVCEKVIIVSCCGGIFVAEERKKRRQGRRRPRRWS